MPVINRLTEANLRLCGQDVYESTAALLAASSSEDVSWRYKPLCDQARAVCDLDQHSPAYDFRAFIERERQEHAKRFGPNAEAKAKEEARRFQKDQEKIDAAVARLIADNPGATPALLHRLAKKLVVDLAPEGPARKDDKPRGTVTRNTLQPKRSKAPQPKR
jgi:hypothetical protein